MQLSDYLAGAAIVVSLLSLGLSAYLGLRNRGRIRATSIFYPPWEDSYAFIQIRVVNCGQRPVILRLLGGDYEDGSWEGSYLGDSKRGLRLGENEIFEETIGGQHSMLLNYDGSTLRDLWFEDTVGCRYKIKSAKENINRLFGAADKVDHSKNGN